MMEGVRLGVSMQNDTYTKVVLTVIAVALVGMLLQRSAQSALAQQAAPIKVVICRLDGNVCANVSTLSSTNFGRLQVEQ